MGYAIGPQEHTAICESCIFKANEWLADNLDVAIGNPLAAALTTNRYGNEKDGDVWCKSEDNQSARFRASVLAPSLLNPLEVSKQSDDLQRVIKARGNR